MGVKQRSNFASSFQKQRPDLPAEFCKVVRTIKLSLDEFPNM
jgi:hypothetical protein